MPILLRDSLHRTLKLGLDTGRFASLAEAEECYRNLTVRIHFAPRRSNSPCAQAAFLTAVNAAVRCFLGGVEITGSLDDSLLFPFPGEKTVGEAARVLGGRSLPPDPLRRVIVAGDGGDDFGDAAIRPGWDGWTGWCCGSGEPIRDTGADRFPPAGVLAGALAVTEVFQDAIGLNPSASRRTVGISLWRPELPFRQAEDGPELRLLPARLWLIGLGHLGQSFLWTLRMLPYEDFSELQLVLQDFDRITIANRSTSPLTFPLMEGKKTRAMAQWCDLLGIDSVIVERPFTSALKVQDGDPTVAICGVDNAVARSALEDCGFKAVFEAGLGNQERFLDIRTHSFPSSRSARTIWNGTDDRNANHEVESRAGYQELVRTGAVDQCGVVDLAGVSVAASFVGLTASALVISDVLRAIAGHHRYEVLAVSLRTGETPDAIPVTPSPIPVNLGFVRARV